ncbi:hypothetical protein [Capnocytophaga haemolytica]
MLETKLIKVLSKVYRWQCCTYNKNHIDWYDVDKAKLSEKESALLSASDYVINAPHKYTHDEVVSRLRELASAEGLEQKVRALFLKAIAEGWARGLQPIVSFYTAKHLPEHAFSASKKENDYSLSGRSCRVSGIPKQTWENDGVNLYHLYIGYCRLEPCAEMVLDLEEVLTFDEVAVTPEYLAAYDALLESLRRAEDNETPSALVKRLATEKVLKGSTSTSRVWLVRILAELGVLPNLFVEHYSIIKAFYPYDLRKEYENILHDNAPARAEPVFPASSWRGAMGIDEGIAKELRSQKY